MTAVHAALLAAGWALIAGPVVLALAHAATHDRVRAPAGVAASVVALAGVGGAVVMTRPALGGAVIAPIAVLGLAAATVDAREGRLPDALTTPLLLTTLAAVAIAAAATSEGGPAVRAVVVGVAFVGCALVVKLVAPSVVGWGDVKFTPSLGAVLGWHDVTATGLVAVLVLVALTAVPMGRSGFVPYGPALVVAAIGAAAGS